jgi:hypothetical protein
MCDVNNSEQMEILYDLYETDPIFKQILSGWFDAVALGSGQAIKLKEWYLLAQRKEPQLKLTPPLVERVKNILERYEQGNIDSWWILNREMTIIEAELRYGNEFEQDITMLPGWKISDSGIRERIIKAAKRYVIEGEPQNKKWMEKKIIFRPAMSGYRALRLILQESHQDLIALDSLLWKKWASIILAYPMWNSEKANDLDDYLLKIAYSYAPSEIERSLTSIIRKENRESGSFNMILTRINTIWDDKLEVFLLRKIKSGKLKSYLFRSILEFLLNHHSLLTQDYAFRKIKSYRPQDKRVNKDDVIATMELLLIHCNEPKWEVIWPSLLLDEKLAGDVIGRLAQNYEREKIFLSLSFTQLADLYLYLVNHYPPYEDNDDKDLEDNGFHGISIREEIGNWRDSILNFMVNSGAPDACSTLRRLVAELPNFEYIKRRLLDAETNMRRKTWIPLTQDELLDLFSRPDTILIESGPNLLDAIIQSLNNLNLRFQGETPAAIFLWNECENKIYRPKDENRLSDFVKLHLEMELQHKGIIVNREVEIRRGNGAPGERTDIHVDAIRKHPLNDGYDKITVIIETKGCWNPELETAMKTQLLERYLKDNSCRFGLYLVGWFMCGSWDNQDSRYKKAPKTSLNEEKTKLEKQAIALSTEEILLKSYILDVTL